MRPLKPLNLQAFSRHIKRLTQDEHSLASHVSLMTALLICFAQQGSQSPFQVTRKTLMAFARIASVATYHKCIKELDAGGYIRYEPSYHPRKGSLIYWLSDNVAEPNESNA